MLVNMHFVFMQKDSVASAKPCILTKSPPANAGDAVLIPGSGRSPGEGNGNPFWYACLENPMDRGAWLATVHGVTKGFT